VTNKNKQQTHFRYNVCWIFKGIHYWKCNAFLSIEKANKWWKV